MSTEVTLGLVPGMLGVRKAKPEERKEVERLIRTVGKHVSDYFAMRNTDEYWNKGEVWVATWGGIYVGFAVVHPLKREPVQSLYQVGVHPEWRGLKVATSLLLMALSEHPDKQTLRLVVNEDNAGAIKMYERWGLTRGKRRETRRNGFVIEFEGVPTWI